MKPNYPNPKNFCGGNFQDWLEVNLTNECNGKCSWCIEKNGFHPKEHVSWQVLANAAIKTQKKNIILLGGEPTSYKNLKEIINYLKSYDRNVYITTNGSKLSPKFISENLIGLCGINISIHDCDLANNKKITGIQLDENTLKYSIHQLHAYEISVRLNCNCITGHIDRESGICNYINWARDVLGADCVRFAELKNDKNNFVNLAKIFNYSYELNDDPFTKGCNQNVFINDFPVNFRQMCGLQTPLRVKPINLIQLEKQVLYYDGIIYNGWQTKESTVVKKENTAKKSENIIIEKIRYILDGVNKDIIFPEDALISIKKVLNGTTSAGKTIKKIEASQSYGCQY
jgi:pyruvate-formate lyase-activating enzyme